MVGAKPPDHARAYGHPVPHAGPIAQEADGSPTVPRSPYGGRPRSETPVGSCALAMPRPGRRPSGHWHTSAVLSCQPGELSSCPQLYALRGSITRPASSLPPAPYAHGWACTWSVLLTGWRGLGQVGLEPFSVLTHEATTTHFMGFRPIPRFRASLGATSAWLDAVAVTGAAESPPARNGDLLLTLRCSAADASG
jgi:hypothetical protein